MKKVIFYAGSGHTSCGTESATIVEVNFKISFNFGREKPLELLFLLGRSVAVPFHTNNLVNCLKVLLMLITRKR